MISAFGPVAERFAAGLGDLEAVIAEPGTILPAYLAAVERRSRGETFYGMVLEDDRRVEFAYSIAGEIAGQKADPDERDLFFAALANGSLPINGKSAAEHWAPEPGWQGIRAEFYGLCDAMLVRSYAEYARLAQGFGRLARPAARVLVEPVVPPFERVAGERPAVVVWAPHRRAETLVLPLVGLHEFLGDVTCVVAGGSLAGFAAEIVSVVEGSRIRHALARAGCVVCVEPNDPGDALAFARRGFGVVAPITAGAPEFVGDVVTWDAAEAGRLHHAVAAALARPAWVRELGDALPRAPARPAAPVPQERLPLVSIVMPTYNRRDDLRAVLQNVAEQTYPKIESIVVNDAGENVADVVAEFPFARLIEHERNCGVHRTLETGKDAARGEYITFLPDDDGIFPDHIERIVYAMLRSRAKVGHGNGLLKYVETQADGGLKTIGYNATTLSSTTTVTHALIATPVSMNGMIYHRSVFEEVGWLINESPLGDVEHQMRVARRFAYVHVDNVTYWYREHPGQGSKKLDFPSELRRLYRDVHPMPERPLLERRREATLAGIEARKPGAAPFSPTVWLR